MNPLGENVPIKHTASRSEEEVVQNPERVGDWEYAAPANVSPLDEPVESVDTRRYPGAFSSDKPSPYAFSPLCGSKIERDAAENPNRLYGARAPRTPINHERAEHRVIIFLKAEGRSNKEIAEITGFTPVTVSNVVRQPWAQEQILRIIHDAGGDAVQTLLQGAAADAVTRLITEMDNDLARPTERINAADKLLDRLYGKPNQPIEHRTPNLSELDDKELERIASTGGSAATATTT